MTTAPIRVFLVDDHPLLRRGVLAVLERAGYESVGTASSADEALERYELADPDVLLLDVSLSPGSGIDVARELCRRHGDRARIVMFSGCDEPDVVAASMRAGALAYVLKGTDPSHVTAAIDAAMRGEAYLCPQARTALAGARQPPADAVGLTPREAEIVRLVAAGLSSKEIAERLGISWRTVGTHRERIMRKLGVHNLAGIVRWALGAGID